MKNELSVFIDESGDFGKMSAHSRYYIVALVFHEQAISLRTDVAALDQNMKNLGFPQHAIHIGPLIRRESVYAESSMEERRHLFHALFHFARRAPIQYDIVKVKKSECTDSLSLTERVSRGIANVILNKWEYFRHFDSVVVYYDNGQIELTKILTAVFHALLTNAVFKKAKTAEYRLFQAADLICTLELLNMKLENGMEFTKSEAQFFGNRRDFKKNYYKAIQKKRI